MSLPAPLAAVLALDAPDLAGLELRYTSHDPHRGWAVAGTVAVILGADDFEERGPELGIVLVAHGFHRILGQAEVRCDLPTRDLVVAQCLARARGRGLFLLERWGTAERWMEIEAWNGRALLGTDLDPRTIEPARQQLVASGLSIEGAGAELRVRREDDDGAANRISGMIMLPFAPLGGRKAFARAGEMLRGKRSVTELAVGPDAMTIEMRVGDAPPLASQTLAARDILGVTGASRPTEGGHFDDAALRVVLADGLRSVFEVADQATARALRVVVLSAIHAAQGALVR